MRSEHDMRRSKPFITKAKDNTAEGLVDNVMGHHRETHIHTALSTVADMVMVMEATVEATVEAAVSAA
jgi:hypothetical protein